MCFREGMAWTCLGSTLAVYTGYYGYVLPRLARGELSAEDGAAALVAAIVAQTVIGIAAGIVLARKLGKDHADERDRAIAFAAERAAYYALVSGVVCLALFGTLLGPPWQDPRAFCQVLLLCVVAAEAIRFGVQVFRYRRGA